MTLPTFFIVGAPKAGTTSLYHYLEEHPEVYMSPIKETNFFSSKQMQEQELYYDATPIQSKNQYLELFKDVSQEKQVGEASVSYLYYTGVAKKILEFNPKAKIVIMLRNPVDRAFSHFLMDKRLGLSISSFMDVIQEPKNFHYTINNMCFWEIIFISARSILIVLGRTMFLLQPTMNLKKIQMVL